ncbi:C45 family autoproteolytic acyltransferase/hydolase [Bacillus salipaludis]|uniref:C45 family autoproteolytic acyltransferase/hydrolase n=1 Tax=Bacillus salipaludis TaxID=2547811 RepID=A0ABW8RK67_9BACI
MIKKLILQGSAKEIGRQHGSKGKDQVVQSLETYEKLFYGFKKLTWKQAREYAFKYVNAIEKLDHQLIEEMEGIAEGAGVDFGDILALNARSEIALANYKGSNFSDGCTAIAITSPLIEDTIIGQNWDWKAQQQNSLLLLEIHQPSKPIIKMVTEGGMIGKIGFNSSGLGVCFNALLTNKSSDSIPIHIGLRSVLDSDSLSEAISKIKGENIAAAASYLIGYDDQKGNGMAVNIEVSPVGIDMVGDLQGRLVHTNHLLSNSLMNNGLTDMNEFIFEDSMLRKKRAEQLISRKLLNKEPLNMEAFKEWFSDQFNAPNSINHFENEFVPEHRRMETVFSIIMNLSKRKMLLCVGKPSESYYEEV